MKLGEWFVEITAKGVGAVKDGIAQITKQLQQGANAQKAYAQAAQSGSNQASQSIKQQQANLKSLMETSHNAGKAIGDMFKYATYGMLGFVAAGLVGTYEGEQLRYQFQMLSQQIAAIFLPVIQTVIQKLQDVVSWFRGLSGEQQDNFMKWGLIVGGIGTLIIVMQKLSFLLPVVSLGWKGLTAAATAAFAHPVIAGIIAITAAIGYLVYKLTSAGESTAKLRDELEKTARLGISQEDMGKSFAVKTAQSKEFQALSPEDQIAKLRKLESESESGVKYGEHLVKNMPSDYGTGSYPTGEHMPGSELLRRSSLDLVAIAKMIEQLKTNGSIDTRKLLRGEEDKDQVKANRQVTPKVGGFEAITSTYNRIQEQAMSRYDPVAAEAERKRQADKQIALLGVIAGKPVAVGGMTP